MGKKEVLQMKQVKRYRMRSIDVPSFYVGGRMGTWGQMVNRKHAWRRTKKWWMANVAPGILKEYFKLEPVGNGKRMGSR